MSRAIVITVSTRAAAGVYDDETGPALVAGLREVGFDVENAHVVSDEQNTIAAAIAAACHECELVVTNGGTGLHPRDVTPEATLEVVERTIPGIAESMRAASVAVTPMAMLSRGIAGVLGSTLVINLPGSPKAAVENLAVVLPVLRHALDQVRGGDHPRPATPQQSGQEGPFPLQASDKK